MPNDRGDLGDLTYQDKHRHDTGPGHVIYHVEVEHGRRRGDTKTPEHGPVTPAYLHHPVDTTHIQVAVEPHGKTLDEMDQEAHHTAYEMATATSPHDMVTRTRILHMEAGKTAGKEDPWYASATDAEIDAHPSADFIHSQIGHHVAPNGKAYRLVKHPGRMVTAHSLPSGRRAGGLTWFSGQHDPDNPSTTQGVIHKVVVSGPHRRKGLATAMLNFARKTSPNDSIAHSTALSDDGKAWAAKVALRLVEAKPEGFDGVSLRQDDDGWYVTTHRARSDSYPTPEDIPKSKVEFIRSTGGKYDDWLPHARIFGPTKGHEDPRLFDGDHLKPEVRREILETLDDYWGDKYLGWHNWAKVYFTGSEASEWYGNNDFDVLVGVNYDRFRKATGSHLDDKGIDDLLNKGFRADLNGPFRFGGDTFDRTWYVNHDSYDIRRLKPYAAYDVTADTWAVRPVEVPKDWGPDKFPASTWRMAERYADEIQRIATLDPKTRQQYAERLFDHIHTDRQRAFSEHGTGVFDVGNVAEKYLDQRPDHPLALLVEMKNAGKTKQAEASTGKPCSACSGSGEQGTGHECYACDGSGRDRDPEVDNANPENGLLVGRDDARGIRPVTAAAATPDSYPDWFPGPPKHVPHNRIGCYKCRETGLSLGPNYRGHDYPAKGETCPECHGVGHHPSADGDWEPAKVPPEQHYKEGEGTSEYHRRTLDIAKAHQAGTHVFRGENRPRHEAANPDSVGMHWSVRDEMASALQRDPDEHQTPVLYHAEISHPDQAVPRSHPTWSGKHRSLDPEAEVRFKPGAKVHVHGAYVWEGEGQPRTRAYPTNPGKTAKGWKYHPIGKTVSIEHKRPEDGMMDYKDLPRHAGAKKDDWEPPSVSGIALRAKDTGRILMIQRSNADEKDPARGTWEFPGGHHEKGDKTSLHAGIREWEEEVGHPFPEGGSVEHTWRTGPYQGHLVVIPEESAVDFSKGRRTTNPDDPDGDDHEQSAWWDPEHARKNPALRQECKDNWSSILPGLKATAAEQDGEYTYRHIVHQPKFGTKRYGDDHPHPSSQDVYDEPSRGMHYGAHVFQHQIEHKGWPVAKLRYSIHASEPNVISIMGLAVHPKHRSKGLAKALNNHMQDHAETHGMVIDHGTATDEGHAFRQKYAKGDSYKPHLHLPMMGASETKGEDFLPHMFEPREIGRTAAKGGWVQYYANEEPGWEEDHDEALLNKDQTGSYHPSNGRVFSEFHQGRHHLASLDGVPISTEEQEARLAPGTFKEQSKPQADPSDHVVAGARAYAASKGMPDPHDIDYSKVKTTADNTREIGRAYHSLPDHDPEAVPHFEAMRREIHDQFHHMTHNMGIKVHFQDEDPYTNSKEMMHDVHHNKTIKVLRTAKTGGHPFFSDEENDKFRAVHDVFGHAATGRGFDKHGEEAAFTAHSKMFSPAARPAMETETRGQNHFYNLNGRFAKQKVALLHKATSAATTHPNQTGRTARRLVYLR